MSHNLSSEDLTRISEDVKLSKKKVTQLYWRFKKLDYKKKGYLDKRDFIRIPELVANPLCARLIDAFFTETSDEEPNKLSFEQFVKVLCYFTPSKKDKDSKEDKLRFAFKMFDLNKDGFINRDELHKVMLIMIGPSNQDHIIHEIVSKCFEDADLDQDNKISYVEFCKTMEKIDVEHHMSLRYLS